MLAHRLKVNYKPTPFSESNYFPTVNVKTAKHRSS